MLKTGDAAPAFKVQDHLGRSHSLGDYRGKTLVLWFYPKADTPGCTREGCAFRDLAAEFAKKNAAILGVSFDTAAENRAFADKFSFNFPLLCDTDRALGVAYGAADDTSAGNARRIGVVIDAEGKVKEYLPKVDASTYPHEVLGRI
ncbi:Thiol peroxidase, Bcp-type [Minicystis rosea]|nr:Thiol peroxidase, Bcp-type [Minicystis rosea]